LSRRFPPLPIDIDYVYRHGGMTTKDMGRMRAALECPDRIRGITFTGLAGDLDTLFKATSYPLPALESLALRHRHEELQIPATFLEGSNLRLRSLKLHRISLPFISRLLSSAPALTCLSLVIGAHSGPLPVVSLLLSHLQGMPCLRHLDLEIRSSIKDLAQPTEPKENFPLSKLAHFHFVGRSIFLNALVAGLSAPSLRDVNIQFYGDMSPPVSMHLSRFIEDIREHYRAVQVLFESHYFRLLLLPHSEYYLSRFRLISELLPESMMQMISTFSAKLTTAEELFLVFVYDDDDDLSDKNVPWRRFFLQFPSVKTLRMEVTNSLHIASALNQGGSDFAFLPVLEEIELCMPLISSTNSEDQPASELVAFQPFVSARQQAGRPVRIFWGPPERLSQMRLQRF